MPAGVLADPLESPVAISFIAQAQAIENQALHDPKGMAALRQAISDGWADVVGGAYSEAEDALLPLESILWQFRRGHEVYPRSSRRSQCRDLRSPAVSACTPSFPRSPSDLVFDSRFTWDSTRADSRSSRRPSGCGRARTAAIWRHCCVRRWRPTEPSQGWLIPWRMAATMKNDHVAALPLVHWPKPVAPWYLDLRRAAGLFSGAGAMDDAQRLFPSDRPPLRDHSPGARSITNRLIWRRRWRGASPSRSGGWPVTIGCGRGSRRHGRSRALARAIASSAAGAGTGCRRSGRSARDVDGNRKPDRNGPSRRGRDRAGPRSSRFGPRRWREESCGTRRRGRPGERVAGPGYLVINPLNVPRRAAVILPDAGLDLRPDGPLRAAQFTDEGVWAVVDLPAFGFAWVPKEADLGRPPASTVALSTRGRQLRNESIEIEIDAVTGGIRSVAGVGESTARLGQQLVMTGLFDAQGKARVLADAVRAIRRRLRRSRARAGDSDRQPDPSATGKSPGLVHPAVSALDRPADPRDRGHAGRSRSRLGSTRRPRPTRGRSTWRAAGRGPTPTRCCVGWFSGLPS